MKRKRYIAAKNNLGVVLLLQLKLQEAEDIFQNLIKSQPQNLEVRRNLSNIFREQNRLDMAEQQLNLILQAEPDNIAARQDLALVLLQQGKFEQGWKEYEWRTVEALQPSERWPFPVWDGGDLANLTVLVFPEQGIGDEIMFASCIADLQARAGRIVLACEPRLVPLMRRSFADIQVIGRSSDQGKEWLDSLVDIDVQVSIASLAKFFRNHVDNFSTKNCYLSADVEAVEKWQLRYEKLGAGLKVGILKK